MATNTSKKLQTMVECPICLGTLTNPTALLCLHFYCNPCVNDLDTVTQARQTGYSCPLCRMFTPKDQLRPMHFINELLDVVAQAKKEQDPCNNCKDNSPSWRCSDCKENFCDDCRKHHDGFSLFKNHDVANFTHAGATTVDKHIFCEKHPGEIVKLHCTDCHQLICILCNGTEHKHHTAQTIDQALQEVIPIIHQNQAKVETQLQTSEHALQEVNVAMEEVRKGYENLDKEIHTKFEEIITKARADRDKAKTDLVVLKTAQMAEYKDTIKELEMNLKSHRNIVQMSKTTLETAKGTSLLNAIQSGLRESLVSHAQAKPADTTYATRPNVSFTAVNHQSNSLIGIVAPLQDSVRSKSTINSQGDVSIAQDDVSLHSTRHQTKRPAPPVLEDCARAQNEQQAPQHSRYIPLSLSAHTTLPCTLLGQVEMGFQCNELGKIYDQLWFIESGTNIIQICSNDGRRIKTAELKSAEECHSLVQTDTGVVVAASNGLFITDMNGDNEQKLLDGKFCDVCVFGDKVYGLEDGEGQVQVLKQHQMGSNKYVKHTEIRINQYNSDPWNTIQLTNQYIYIALCSASKILQLSHTGESVATHGSCETDVIQLGWPHLCGADPQGDVLVADMDNDSLLILRSDGVVQGLTVEGLAESPWHAVLTDNRMLVMCDVHTFQEFTF